MIVYVVVYNGKVSSEGYRTFEEAKQFCESRGAKQKGDSWNFEDGCDLYQILDVCVRNK